MQYYTYECDGCHQKTIKRRKDLKGWCKQCKKEVVMTSYYYPFGMDRKTWIYTRDCGTVTIWGGVMMAAAAHSLSGLLIIPIGFGMAYMMVKS